MYMIFLSLGETRPEAYGSGRVKGLDRILNTLSCSTYRWLR